jgi:hypothetical protein
MNKLVLVPCTKMYDTDTDKYKEETH